MEIENKESTSERERERERENVKVFSLWVVGYEGGYSFSQPYFYLLFV